MKNIEKKMKCLYPLTMAFLFAVASLFLPSCSPEGDKLSLEPLPSPDFEIQQGEDENTMLLINRTSVPSIAYWTIESTEQKFEGDTISVRFTFEGSYPVTLQAASQGGMASITKEVTIAQNDPTACNPDRALGFIAGCAEKTWRLNPAAGALKVGPGADDGSWWSSGDGDVNERVCDFNDEYTFAFNPEGTFTFDNQGDFYADGYLGNRTFGCEPSSNLSGNQANWDSGSFNFSVINGAGVNGLGQLRVIGTGAHIGVRKAHNGGEDESGPTGNVITYDIIEMTQNVDGQGYDLLKIGVNIGGDGWWTYTLRSY